VKTTAELFEQVDAVGSAVGTTRAAVRRPILSPEIMCSELLCRARPDAGLGHLAKRWTYGVGCAHELLIYKGAGDQDIVGSCGFWRRTYRIKNDRISSSYIFINIHWRVYNVFLKCDILQIFRDIELLYIYINILWPWRMISVLGPQVDATVGLQTSPTLCMGRNWRCHVVCG
jgi:hypothetical protein